MGKIQSQENRPNINITHTNRKMYTGSNMIVHKQNTPNNTVPHCTEVAELNEYMKGSDKSNRMGNFQSGNTLHHFVIAIQSM